MRRFIWLGAFLLIVGFAKAQDTPLSIVSHVKGAPQDLKLNALKSILKGERQRWADGTKITIALMKTNTPAGSAICRKIYNMSADELNKYWLALVFQGKGQAPVFFNSTAELEAFIAQTPGAIGVTTATGNNTHTITVDGKKVL
ncbi:MAG TPA: hypothetical protein VNR87_16610 [Flavisolibacter sp.]|nr:hypothetical protein [Flavisolibacter sp.]